ncbi:MAG: hypothetical protein NZZ41_04125 [Candidatus Dojkabacteria bacterium]|nr:hypothetical protein [Candidatus Dojkabacteria bacterium]
MLGIFRNKKNDDDQNNIISLNEKILNEAVYSINDVIEDMRHQLVSDEHFLQKNFFIFDKIINRPFVITDRSGNIILYNEKFFNIFKKELKNLNINEILDIKLNGNNNIFGIFDNSKKENVEFFILKREKNKIYSKVKYFTINIKNVDYKFFVLYSIYEDSMDFIENFEPHKINKLIKNIFDESKIYNMFILKKNIFNEDSFIYYNFNFFKNFIKQNEKFNLYEIFRPENVSKLKFSIENNLLYKDVCDIFFTNLNKTKKCFVKVKSEKHLENEFFVIGLIQEIEIFENFIKIDKNKNIYSSLKTFLFDKEYIGNWEIKDEILYLAFINKIDSCDKEEKNLLLNKESFEGRFIDNNNEQILFEDFLNKIEKEEKVTIKCTLTRQTLTFFKENKDKGIFFIEKIF